MKSIGFYYGSAFNSSVTSESNVADMFNVDKIVMGSYPMNDLRTLWPWLVEAFTAKTLLYLDHWGCSYSSVIERPYACWQLGPQDFLPSLPPIRSPKNPYPYRMDKHQDQRFAEMALRIMGASPWIAAKGLFIDDFSPDVLWWNLTTEERAIIWPDGPNRQEEMEVLSRWLQALAALRKKDILFNGPVGDGPRLYESVGHWKTWEDILQAKPGDALLVKGILADGHTWGNVLREGTGWKVGTSFRDVFKDCMDLAKSQDLHLGLVYSETPDNGHWSTGVWHSFTNPVTWEKL